MSIFKKKIADTVVEGMEAADDLFSSKKELAEEYSLRHQNDMTSDSWLSKNVRPIYLLGTWLLVLIMVVAISLGRDFDVVVFTAVVGMASGASGWYFSERNSMKNQKMLIKMYEKQLKELKKNKEGEDV